MNQSTPVAKKRDAQVIALVSTGHAVAHFYNLLLPPLFPWIKQSFVLTWSQLGLVMSVYFLVSGMAQTVAGLLVDRCGARRVLVAGLLCLALAACIFASATSYAMLMVGAVFAGLGNSVFHPADFSLINQYVSCRSLGHAFSSHGVSGQLGWALAPVFLLGIASFSGWRMALFAAACLPLLVLLAFYLQRNLFDQQSLVASQSKKVANDAAWSFLRLPAVWGCFAFFFVSALALGGVQNFSSTGLQQLYAVSIAWAALALTIYMLASAGGMVCGGFLAGKTTQHERVIATAFAVAGGAACLIATAHVPAWSVLLLMAVTGFGAGVAGPSRDFLIRSAAPKEAIGRVYGVVYGGLELGFASAPLLFAYLLDNRRPDLVFVAIGAFQLLAIVTAVGVKSTLLRQQPKPHAVGQVSR